MILQTRNIIHHFLLLNQCNECAIIYQEKGVLQTRRPDRVMMKDGEVIVVDFKFGKKRKAYNKQVKEYMDLLWDMSISVAIYGMYLTTNWRK